MRTLDFTLALATLDQGGYRVDVVESPAGLPAEVCDEDLDAAAFDPDGGGDPRRFGLFERLFPGDVGRALLRALDLIRLRGANGEDVNLRVRLQFRGSGERAPWDDPQLARDLVRLAAVPWEFVHHPERGTFLALDGPVAIVRRIDTRQIADLPPVEAPIRALVVSCQPRNCQRLALEAERQEIERSLELSETFEPDFLIDPDFETFERKVADFKPHLLHFMGHGGFRPERREGHLSFVDADGLAERVPAHRFAECLGRCPTLRLAFLNACDTAQIQRRETAEVFAATATAVLAHGVPAVVANQFPIDDDVALRFSRAFYAALPAQESIETAVWSGRRAISETAQFGTPALYLQAQDGHLFATRRAEPTRRDDSPRVSLAVQSFKGFGRRHAAICDAVLDLCALFDGRKIRDPEAWNRDILRRLVRFLTRQVKEELPLDLIANAHQSIAFTLGYLLESKAGIDSRFYQRGQAGMEARHWRPDEGPVPRGDLWRPLTERRIGADGQDLALAISITQFVQTDVLGYLGDKGPIGTLYHAEVPEPGQDAVSSGAHAAKLAQQLHTAIYRQATGLRRGTLHLFGSAPNAFFFFLGRHAVPWGRIQLYEFDFRGQGDGSYSPSILLDPQTLPKVGSRDGLRFLFT